MIEFQVRLIRMLVSEDPPLQTACTCTMLALANLHAIQEGTDRFINTNPWTKEQEDIILKNSRALKKLIEELHSDLLEAQ